MDAAVAMLRMESAIRRPNPEAPPAVPVMDGEDEDKEDESAFSDDEEDYDTMPDLAWEEMTGSKYKPPAGTTLYEYLDDKKGELPVYGRLFDLHVRQYQFSTCG